jgi:beta-carotene ketolase (CrtW type)
VIPFLYLYNDKSINKRKLSFVGLLTAIAIIEVWATNLILLMPIDVKEYNVLFLLIAIALQSFLYTGLFITAHDAMHGVVCPSNNKINHSIGWLCLNLYGFLSYSKLLKKHWLHHHNPATSEVDPDFHNGKDKNFWSWYLFFMKNYWSWQQMLFVTILYNFLHYGFFHIPHLNLNLFWVIPSILSSLQLFYFGTFIPHSEPAEGYVHPHRARTISRPVWLSFITCYHFGYHEEHHEFPHVPWWGLPNIYQLKREKSTINN